MVAEQGGLAVVTGASTGIGLELARVFVENGFDVVAAADEASIDDAARSLETDGRRVLPVQADLATAEGVEQLVGVIEGLGRPLDALAVNAGIGVNGPLVETELGDHLRLIGLNVTGAVHLTHRLVRGMAVRGAGRVLFTSSIAAMVPGPYQSTYNASKAFLYSFAEAIRIELEDVGVTVTALMPGPTSTEFFERADMEDTKLAHVPMDDPAEVARDGFEAMMAGKDHVVAGGLRNNVQALSSKLLPGKASAAAHAKLAEPGSADA
jgi:short-subunit dehydrogenase